MSKYAGKSSIEIWRMQIAELEALRNTPPYYRTWPGMDNHELTDHCLTKMIRNRERLIVNMVKSKLLDPD